MVAPFIGAFIFPAHFGHFVYHTAILIFVIEFFSIHSSLAVRSLKKDGRKTSAIFILCIYAFFTLGFSLAIAKSIYPSLAFIARLTVKLLMPQPKSVKIQKWGDVGQIP